MSRKANKSVGLARAKGRYDGPREDAPETRCAVCNERIVQDVYERWVHEDPDEVFFTWEDHEAEPLTAEEDFVEDVSPAKIAKARVRLASLREMRTDRGCSVAEAATARRIADALEAEVRGWEARGRGPGRRRRTREENFAGSNRRPAGGAERSAPRGSRPRRPVGVTVRTEDGESLPSINVKPPPLYYSIPEDLRKRASESTINAAFESVQEYWWGYAAPHIAWNYLSSEPFSGASPEVSSAGRSGGHLVVRGLGDVYAWTPAQVRAWEDFEAAIKESMVEAERLFHEEIRSRVEEP